MRRPAVFTVFTFLFVFSPLLFGGTPASKPTEKSNKNPKKRDVVGRTLFVEYDHATGTLACDGVTVANRLCQLRGSEGDAIAVTVKNALPSLFQYNISSTPGSSPELSRQIATTLGFVPTQTAGTSGSTQASSTPSPTPSPSATDANIVKLLPQLGLTLGEAKAFKNEVGETIETSEVETFLQKRSKAPLSEAAIQSALRTIEPPRPPSEVTSAYNALMAAADAVRLTMYDLNSYHQGIATFREKRRDLLNLLSVPDDPNEIAKEVAKRIKAEGSVPPAESVVAEEWRRETTALKDAAPEFSPIGPIVFPIADRDLTISIEITPKSDYFGGPSQKAIVMAGINQPWRITTTTGFVISGLVDDSYSVKQVTDSTSNPPTTRNTALLDKHDSFRPPEAAFLVHVGPGWGGFADRFAWSFGLGITSGAAGRAYLGLTYRLGSVAALTLGGVGGKVKRLGSEVDLNNLGSVVPNDKLRDVYRTGWMVGISWKIAQ